MSLERLLRAMGKHERVCVGLISGTSVDAAEAALCRIRGSGAGVSLELLAHLTLPFGPDLRERVLTARTPQQVCALNVELGERFAEAALALLRHAGLAPEDVDAIGSHGQTIAHLPPGAAPFPSTLQIGEPSVIAERTGIPTIADFRPRDMAAGGQGAPLVPYADWALFRKSGAYRALQNIGGIANVSVIGDRLEDTLAFDTGPGNMILDALARRATGGALDCDRDGTLSAQGRVLPELLEELLRHPLLHQPPPRSGGREGFGEPLAADLWARHGGRPFDLIATAAAFTVEATARAFEQWVLPRFGALEGIYLSGGGSRNPTLVEGLRRRLASIPVEMLDRLGFPEAAKEAACFALLASECLAGTPQNVPSATGASRPVLMGKMVP
ncbi:MAG TPA: anhydro-N-acetylmuramic acid kinase [Myxococcaceae bacterium]|nr:anhydro-N-acetylmuramic acid kinase [Myxococcaceae bacterium]